MARTRPGLREGPRAVRLLRQAAAAPVLQADLEQPAAPSAAGSDRLLDPAPLHPDRDLTPAEQQRPRGLIAPAAGIAADLDPVTHAATSPISSDSQARWALAHHDQAPPWAAAHLGSPPCHRRRSAPPEGTSDAAAVGAALTARDAVRRQPAGSPAGAPAAGAAGCSPNGVRPHRGLRRQAGQHPPSGAVRPALRHEQVRTRSCGSPRALLFEPDELRVRIA
jgi:hypothetical protein